MSQPKVPVDEADPSGGFDELATTQRAAIDIKTVSDARRVPVLRQMHGPGAPRDIPLSVDEVVVGRMPGVTIAIDSADLSRRHMRVRKAPAGLVCEDLDSRNGVYLNGVKIHSAVLSDGDQLQLGDVVFLFLEAG